MIKKFVVITTINRKTEAIQKFEDLPGWHILIVGDKKTPHMDNSETTTFFSLAEQETSNLEIARLLPYNHYCRKNSGYLRAIHAGARIIYDTDDDNFPYNDWHVPEFTSDTVLQGKDRVINVYQYFTDRFIWPRGFPLDALRDTTGEVMQTASQKLVGVWQAMADGDPDVDAIYRLVNGETLCFEKRPPVHLDQGIYCPFNSQATAWAEKALPFLYLPCTVSFRFTDILRGYVAQRLMWGQGLHLGFTSATVYQERNPHNLMQDFSDEVEMYLNVRKVMGILDGINLSGDALKDLYEAYRALCESGIVKLEELNIVSAWNRDFEKGMSVSGKPHG